MGKMKVRHQNTKPFLPDNNGNSIVSIKTRSKSRKHHQLEEPTVSKKISSKILNEALIQKREVEGETTGKFILSHDDEELPVSLVDGEYIDDFPGFSEAICLSNQEELINEDDEKLLEAFFSKDAGPQRTLADIIAEKIIDKNANISSQAKPKALLDESVRDTYKGVGHLLSKYTSGPIPLAFKSIPAMHHWEDVLSLTEPEKWSPNAMYQATRIFTSHLPSKKVESFYRFVLLPRIREDIKKNKRLHFALYQCLKKSLFKPAAFNRGILFPLCKSGTCTVREAFIVGSIIQKISIPVLHSGAALMRLAEMEYCGTTSYFIKIFIEKKYALQRRVVNALVDHFVRFANDSRMMPVIWHLSLLAFVQRYRNGLEHINTEELMSLVKKQKHRLITPEIIKELENARCNPDDTSASKCLPVGVTNKAVMEDRSDVPEVPMEED